MSTELLRLVRDLVAREKEGVYYDFKEKHHDKAADLVHDVLCLANATYNGDRYLVYGVRDSDRVIVGLAGSDGRRTQASIVDTLHGQAWWEARAPEVVLHTVMIDGVEVDVLTIFDRPFKPYVLAEDTKAGQGKPAKAHHVYTRIEDRNTPHSESAPPDHVAAMWRERFGLTTYPRDRMRELLRDPSQWDVDFDNRKVAYHRVHAEYRIELDEDYRNFDRPEPYCYFYSNPDSSTQNARFYYNATELFQRMILWMDGHRRLIPGPQWWMITVGGVTGPYFGFLLDSVDGDLAYFLSDGTLDFDDYRGGYGPFCIFRDDADRKDFETAVKEIITPEIVGLWQKGRQHTKQEDPDSRWEPGITDGLFKLNEQWVGGWPLDLNCAFLGDYRPNFPLSPFSWRRREGKGAG